MNCMTPARAVSRLVLATLIGCRSETSRSDSNAHQESSDTARVKQCGVTTTTTLGPTGVGALQIGMSVEAVRAACTLLRDETDPLGNEGMPERRVTVLV